ncbi:MAG: hypothetical protein FWE74_07565 [Oscillospiraceae bacterium]|nr:hypothetical protein [Oscillospiraceae bacterium]
MKRLSNRGKCGKAYVIGVDSYNLREPLSYYKLNLIENALDRLAAYEDSGLTPSQIKKLMVAANAFCDGQQKLS